MKKKIEQIKPLTDRELSLSLKYFVENLLQLKQTMLYLGIDIEDVEIKLSKTDWQYILRETKYDRNGKAIKFLKESDIDGCSFELCGIMVSYE